MSHLAAILIFPAKKRYLIPIFIAHQGQKLINLCQTFSTFIGQSDITDTFQEF
jgi:hypothetical protein